MDFEFHYYITGIIAGRAGFSENDAKIIGYASQFVPDHGYLKTQKGLDADLSHLSLCARKS
jgi:hypothetical protein